MTTKPRVFCTRRLPDEVMDRLARETDLAFHADLRNATKEEVIAGAQGREALLCTVANRVDVGLLDACPGLKVVANYGVGINHIDLAAATARGIAVTNTPDVLTASTADLTFGLIIATVRRFHEAGQLVRERRWTGWEPLELLGRDVSGATLGVIGFGRIGQAVARRARAFDMRILYWNRTRLEPDIELEQGVEFRERDELLAEADIVTLNIAYTPDTHHLIDEAALARMKATAVLVNTARGPIVDEKALARALREQRIAGAGLDVYEHEPRIEPDLMDLPGCMLLPHIGSATVGTRIKMGLMALDGILAACAGRRPPNCVNPEVFAPR